jgi:hypothetical protein
MASKAFPGQTPCHALICGQDGPALAQVLVAAKTAEAVRTTVHTTLVYLSGQLLNLVSEIREWPDSANHGNQ